MKTTEDIAWPGGAAASGESVDPDTIPDTIRARWVEDGVLVTEEGDVAADWMPATNEGGE